MNSRENHQTVSCVEWLQAQRLQTQWLQAQATNDRARLRRHPVAGCVVLAALALLAAACTSNSTAAETQSVEAQLGEEGVPSIDDVSGGTSTPEGPAGSVDEYAACMEENGVIEGEIDFSDEAENEAFLAASDICSPDPQVSAAELGELSRALATCAREEVGIDVPDDLLLRDEDDPIFAELDALELTPDQERKLQECEAEIDSFAAGE